MRKRRPYIGACGTRHWFDMGEFPSFCRHPSFHKSRRLGRKLHRQPNRTELPSLRSRHGTMSRSVSCRYRRYGGIDCVCQKRAVSTRAARPASGSRNTDRKQRDPPLARSSRAGNQPNRRCCGVKRLSRGSMRSANIPRSKHCKGFCGAMGICKGNTAHLYQDAAEALLRWHRQDTCSRSIHRICGGAEALLCPPTLVTCRAYFPFFRHRNRRKRQAESFTESPRSWNTVQTTSSFFDVLEELHAARSAGLQTVLVDRPQDYPNPGSIPKATAEWSLSDFWSVMTEWLKSRRRKPSSVG